MGEAEPLAICALGDTAVAELEREELSNGRPEHMQAHLPLAQR